MHQSCEPTNKVRRMPTPSIRDAVVEGSKVNTGKVIIGSAYIAPPAPPSRDDELLQANFLRYGMPLSTMERISRPPKTFIGRMVRRLVEWL